MYSTEKKNNFFTFLLILFPVSLVSGPLLPEIISFLFLIYFFLDFSNFKKKNILNNKIILFLFLLYFYLLFISFLKIELYEVISDQFFYFRFILFSLAIYSLVSINKKIFNYLGYSLAVLFFLLILDVIIQFSFGKNLLGMETFTQNRFSGLFGDELILGGFLSKFFPLLIGFIYINEDFKYKNILITFFCLMVVIGVFISGERTALGLTFVTLFFLFIKKDMRKMSMMIGILILISLIILSYYNKSQRYRIFIEPFHQMSLLSENFLNKYDDVSVGYTKESLKKFNIFSKHHHDHYITGIRIFKDNILFGVGPEQFRVQCKLKKYATVQDPCSTHPHNFLIQVLSETGLIGLFFYLFVLIFLIKKIYKSINLKKHGNIKDIEYFVYLSFLINLWPFFPSGNLFNNWLSFLLYFPLGFYLCTINYKNERI